MDREPFVLDVVDFLAELLARPPLRALDVLRALAVLPLALVVLPRALLDRPPLDLSPELLVLPRVPLAFPPPPLDFPRVPLDRVFVLDRTGIADLLTLASRS